MDKTLNQDKIRRTFFFAFEKKVEKTLLPSRRFVGNGIADITRTMPTTNKRN